METENHLSIYSTHIVDFPFNCNQVLMIIISLITKPINFYCRRLPSQPKKKPFGKKYMVIRISYCFFLYRWYPSYISLSYNGMRKSRNLFLFLCVLGIWNLWWDVNESATLLLWMQHPKTQISTFFERLHSP